MFSKSSSISQSGSALQQPLAICESAGDSWVASVYVWQQMLVGHKAKHEKGDIEHNTTRMRWGHHTLFRVGCSKLNMSPPLGVVQVCDPPPLQTQLVMFAKQMNGQRNPHTFAPLCWWLVLVASSLWTQTVISLVCSLQLL